jgi:hypothetical protein
MNATKTLDIIDVDTAFELIVLEELLATTAIDPSTSPVAYYYYNC